MSGATHAEVPAKDRYGHKIALQRCPVHCGYFGAVGYAVGKIRADGACWFNAYLDGSEIVDGFSTATDAWDAIARYDAGVQCNAGIGRITHIAFSQSMDAAVYTVQIDPRLSLRLLGRDLSPV